MIIISILPLDYICIDENNSQTFTFNNGDNNNNLPFIVILYIILLRCT